MFMNILNSPNYTSSELQAETEGGGVGGAGKAGRMRSQRQGTLLMLPLSTGCIIFEEEKMHSERVSVTYITEGISMLRTAFKDLFANGHKLKPDQTSFLPWFVFFYRFYLTSSHSLYLNPTPLFLMSLKLILLCTRFLLSRETFSHCSSSHSA